MDLKEKLQQVKERYDELNQAMADPAIYDRPQEYAELTIEHTQLKELVEDYDEWQSLTHQISGNEELIEMDEDDEITAMAKEEIGK
jgi:peptide chain release factor 1